MRLGIVGSREFLDYSLLAETVDNFVEKPRLKSKRLFQVVPKARIRWPPDTLRTQLPAGRIQA